MFDIQNLNKKYFTQSGYITHALRNTYLKLPDQGMCFIIGKSGSGKTSLLNILTGLDNASDGLVNVCKTPITNLNQKHLDNYRNGMIGFIFQEFNLIEDMSVYENIVLALQLQGKKPDNEVVNQLIIQVGLDNSFLNRKINELSGGQKQRVAICRALIKSSNTIFADEPTGSLDSETGKQIFDLLQILSKTKLVIIVSHDKESAYQYADRIIEFKDGQIVADMTRRNKTTKKHKKTELKEGQVLTADMLKNLNALKENDSIQNFAPTDVTNIVQESTSFTAYPSRLPFSFIFKTALKSFNNKKFFFILTSLITVIFSFFVTFHGLRDLCIRYYSIIPKVEKMLKLSTFEDNSNVRNQFINIMEKRLKYILSVQRYICNWKALLFIMLPPGVMILIYFSMNAKMQNKKIGILRALGSNGVNIGKIFTMEAFIFAFFQMILVFVLSLIILIRFHLTSFMFSSFQMDEFPEFTTVQQVSDFITNNNEILSNITLEYYGNPNANNAIINFVRWITVPFLKMNPFIRVLSYNAITLIYVFTMTMIFMSWIIYRWSTKKPINIINNK